MLVNNYKYAPSSFKGLAVVVKLIVVANFIFVLSRNRFSENTYYTIILKRTQSKKDKDFFPTF